MYEIFFFKIENKTKFGKKDLEKTYVYFFTIIQIVITN